MRTYWKRAFQKLSSSSTLWASLLLTILERMESLTPASWMRKLEVWGLSDQAAKDKKAFLRSHSWEYLNLVYLYFLFYSSVQHTSKAFVGCKHRRSHSIKYYACPTGRLYTVVPVGCRKYMVWPSLTRLMASVLWTVVNTCSVRRSASPWHVV